VTFFLSILGTKTVDEFFLQGLKVLMEKFIGLKMLMENFIGTKKCDFIF